MKYYINFCTMLLAVILLFAGCSTSKQTSEPSPEPTQVTLQESKQEIFTM